jgi:hypothetical protein
MMAEGAVFEEVMEGVKLERPPRRTRETLAEQQAFAADGLQENLSDAELRLFDDMREQERTANERWAEGDRDSAPASPAPAAPADDVETLRRERDEARLGAQRADQYLQAVAAQQARAAQVAQYHPAQQEIPSASSDPVGHLLKRVELQEQREALRMQQEAQAAQQQAVAQRLGGLISEAQRQEREFEAKQSDYADAVKHLTAGRARELEIAGYGPAERAQIIQQEGLGAAARALQLGRNPAEFLYQTAIERGYRPGRGTTEQYLRRLEAGHKQARSLSNVGGRSKAPLNAEVLANMSDRDFAEAISTPAGMALLGS